MTKDVDRNGSAAMKGVVLSIPNAGIKKTDVTYYLKRYGVLIFLGLALVIGMVFGSLSAGQADEQMDV